MVSKIFYLPSSVINQLIVTIHGQPNPFHNHSIDQSNNIPKIFGTLSKKTNIESLIFPLVRMPLEANVLQYTSIIFSPYIQNYVNKNI